MNARHMTVSRGVARASAAAALAAAACLASAAAVVRDDSGVVEEIVVTGSWIPGTPEDDEMPVSRLERDDLRDRGSPGIVDLVRNLSFSQGADGESDQYGSRTGADRATVNLRGLGPSRSLVLLNGHRMTWSPGSVPDQAQLVVDVNLLPEAAFERVEVLRDGAAATYGSDAIAGVVNFITRRRFEGVEVEVRHRALAGSTGDHRLGFVAGGEFAGGSLRIVTSLGLASRAALPMRERHWAVRPYAENRRGGWSGTGHPAVFVPLDAFAASAGGAAGMYASSIVDPNCERVGGAHTNAPPGRPEGGVCRYQYTPFINLVQETRRWQWFTEGGWRLADGTRLWGELLAARTDVPSWMTSPSYPPSEVIDLARVIQASNPALVDMAAKYPHLYGDYAWCAGAHCRWRGDGGEQDAAGVPPAWQDVGWINGRHYGQGGPHRGHPRESTARRLVLGADGEFGSASWNAALTASEARRLEEDADGLDYRSLRAQLGLGGRECEELVPNRYDGTGNLDFDWRTLRDHAGRGPCRYWFPFSNALEPHERVAHAANPDYEARLDDRGLADYLITARGFRGRTSLWMLEGVLGGDTGWRLPGGALAYAVGGQVRREHYRRREYAAETGARGGALQDLALYPCRGGPAVFDCTAGRTGVFIYLPPGHDSDANRSILAAFAELAAPLGDDLSARFAVRQEAYPGQDLASLDPKASLRWQPTPSLTLRASAGTTFRAPTINQIEPGIAATSRQFVRRIGTFKPIRARGSTALEPETAATFNAGAVFDRDSTLAAGDRVFASVDVWRYAFRKPLVLEPYLEVLDLACPPGRERCAAGSPWIDRLDFGGGDSVADISSVTVSVVNGPDVDTGGVDFRLEYLALADWGEWSAGVAGTRTLSWEIGAWRFGAAHDAIGRLNYDTSLARTVLDWKGRVWFNARVGGVNLRWSANYTSGYLHDGADEPPIPAHLSHDLVAAWASADDRWAVDVAVMNAADEDPPPVLRQINYDPLTHDPLGRIVQAGIRWRL